MGILKLYKNCSDLPVRRFFDIIETGDLRHLTKCDDIEDVTLTEDTPKVWEAIVDEYTQLSNNYQYTAQLNKQSALLKEINRVNTILAALQILKYGSVTANEVLEYFGIKFKNVKELKAILSKLQGQKTRLAIRKQELDKKSGGKSDFYKLLASVERETKRSIDIEKISVKHWCAIINDLKDARENTKK